MYNFVCVKWGSKYSPEYVNKLYSMVKRNFTLPHRFVCFTENKNGIDSHIETKPLPPLPIADSRQGWWFKLSLFQNPLHDLKGKTLYMDLDVVIVDNINCFLTYKDEFCIIRDWNSRRSTKIFYNSSIFSYNIGSHPNLWNDFIKNPEVNMKTPGGDQIWITRNLPNAQFWPAEWCSSFKYQSEKGIPEGSKVVIFHGKPDPHEADNWSPRNKKYETNWIKEYWR